jgi:hypothetical protein
MIHRDRFTATGLQKSEFKKNLKSKIIHPKILHSFNPRPEPVEGLKSFRPPKSDVRIRVQKTDVGINPQSLQSYFRFFYNSPNLEKPKM